MASSYLRFSLQQRQDLARRISALEDVRLRFILKLVRSLEPRAVQTAGEEYEFDIAQLRPPTIRAVSAQLDHWLQRQQKKKKTKKKPTPSGKAPTFQPAPTQAVTKRVKRPREGDEAGATVDGSGPRKVARLAAATPVTTPSQPASALPDANTSAVPPAALPPLDPTSLPDSAPPLRPQLSALSLGIGDKAEWLTGLDSGDVGAAMLLSEPTQSGDSLPEFLAELAATPFDDAGSTPSAESLSLLRGVSLLQTSFAKDVPFPIETGSPMPFVKAEAEARPVWGCPVCTFDNEMDISTCWICSAPKPALGSSTRPKAGGSKAFKAVVSVFEAKNKTADGMWMCEHCGRKFRTRSDLIPHVRTHTGEKPYACTWPGCSSRFAHSSNLRVHERSHRGVKRYKCDQCNKAFAHPTSLRDHKMSHLGIRPYMCDYPECGSRFTALANMKRHRKLHDKYNGLLPRQRKERERARQKRFQQGT